jgi:hypothetical protein
MRLFQPPLPQERLTTPPAPPTSARRAPFLFPYAKRGKNNIKNIPTPRLLATTMACFAPFLGHPLQSHARALYLTLVPPQRFHGGIHLQTSAPWLRKNQWQSQQTLWFWYFFTWQFFFQAYSILE